MTIRRLRARKVADLPGSPEADTFYLNEESDGKFSLHVSNNDSPIALSSLIHPGSNLIPNTRFQINQRAFAGGALAGGVHGHDLFKADTGGCEYTVTDGVANITSGSLVHVIDGADISFTGPHKFNWWGTSSLTVNGIGVGKGETATLTKGSNATLKWAGGTLSEMLACHADFLPVYMGETRREAMEAALWRYERISSNSAFTPLAVHQVTGANTTWGTLWSFSRKRVVPTALQYSSLAHFALWRDGASPGSHVITALNTLKFTESSVGIGGSVAVASGGFTDNDALMLYFNAGAWMAVSTDL